MLKPKTLENENEENEMVSAGRSRSLYHSAKYVKINSFQNNDTNLSRKTPPTNGEIHHEFFTSKS